MYPIKIPRVSNKKGLREWSDIESEKGRGRIRRGGELGSRGQSGRIRQKILGINFMIRALGGGDHEDRRNLVKS